MPVPVLKTYILPILDFNSQVWSPSFISDITRLESVQRLFTKRLVGFELLSYDERLLKLGMCTLELRRLRLDLFFFIQNCTFTDKFMLLNLV